MPSRTPPMMTMRTRHHYFGSVNSDWRSRPVRRAPQRQHQNGIGDMGGATPITGKHTTLASAVPFPRGRPPTATARRRPGSP